MTEMEGKGDSGSGDVKQIGPDEILGDWLKKQLSPMNMSWSLRTKRRQAGSCTRFKKSAFIWRS